MDGGEREGRGRRREREGKEGKRPPRGAGAKFLCDQDDLRKAARALGAALRAHYPGPRV